uniref:Uncharacterized protein LOC100180038 n=1 Tax=Phallusia mammillata TaxID=59560 RepID=A0A6F9DLH7_9ASCI|nr:uncharacterized protein LOC100180038 [Phallusia mammillata]
MTSLYAGFRPGGRKPRVDYAKSISGLYATSNRDQKVEVKVDVDQPGPYQTALNMISGTLVVTGGQKWTGKSTAAFFRSYADGVTVTSQTDGTHVTADVNVTLSDGGKREGTITAVAKTAGRLKLDMTIKIENALFQFHGVSRQSQHFRDVTLDIDYVDKKVWPIIELKDFTTGPMANRKIDLFSVFEDAGLKLRYDDANSDKVADPTPGTAWSMADMSAVMDDFFDEGGLTDQHIWCLMATNPPDSRYMGFSFDNNKKKGFGLFLGHTSFNGMESDEKKVKVNATRRFLHYLAHECGHCLGLSHPFEEGKSDALSWMNYAWKYDSLYGAGSFYDFFKYQFSDNELVILRHQPDKPFKDAYEQTCGEEFEFAPGTKSSAPDADSDDENDEDGEYGDQSPNKRAKMDGARRKVKFSIKFRPKPYQKGDIVEFEATMKNVGRLPCKIEPGFEPGTGNLTVYVTNPEGVVKIANPLVRTIDPPTRRFVILGKPGSRENSDTYCEVVPLLQSSKGPLFNKIGTYVVKAVYETTGFKLTSASENVIIETDNDDDDATKSEVARVASLSTGSSYGPQSPAVKYWKKLASKVTGEKKDRIQMLLLLMKGFANDSIKISRAGRSTRGRKRKAERAKSAISLQKLISDSQDLLDYYHSNPNSDLMNYVKLVQARSEILSKDNKAQKADGEFAQLVADLVRADADFDLVKRAAEQWKKLLKQDEAAKQSKGEMLQMRFEQLFRWQPSGEVDDEQDASGLGLAAPFNNFDGSHKAKAAKFIRELERIEENTDDLDAVLDYAEAMQKSFEVNPELYKWAIECYIVHSKLAKKNHVRYPDPPKMDSTFTSMAAMIKTVRKGKPEESWMNYWRCDGDFNFHHRHWHSVYRAGSFDQGYKKRQGELFGYMHSQMLARYDADRESWGLDPVRAYEYDEVEPYGFDAGYEFHNSGEFGWMVPRPKERSWPMGLQTETKRFEEALIKAYEAGTLRPRGFEAEGFSPNFAGHLIEPTTYDYAQDFGGIHNTGHMAFTQGLPPRKSTYMGSAQTAVRDPIFFRWHKRVDDILQKYYELQSTELGDENPGVVLAPCDVLILPGREAPAGFDQWNGRSWAREDFTSASINTFLKEPILAYEWDNKLDHEPFTFHVRLRRNRASTGQLKLTLRVFMCQKRHMNDRKRWIEMDKFVHQMEANEDHIVLKRFDIHSSVIKRLHENWSDVKEMNYVEPTPGNCDCGWPYSMLVPRGLKNGEDWMLGVFVSNNVVDQINVASACGSMSYCGTAYTTYPDSRTMGFPFSTPITIKETEVTIEEAALKLDNFCLTPFKIVNDFELPQPPLPPSPIAWAPFSLVGKTGKGDYSTSRLTGRYRVLLDDEDFRKMGLERVKLRFHGRGEGKGSYSMKNVKVQLRKGNTMNIDSRVNVAVTFNNLNTVEVTEEGATSDEIVLGVKTGPGNDYFVTFDIESPGCFTRGKTLSRINCHRIKPEFLRYGSSESDNWDNVPPKHMRASKYMYCVESMLSS